MVAGRCYTYYCRRMVGINVDVESFVVGLSVWTEGSVREVQGDVEEVADFKVCAYRNVQSLFPKFSCDALSSPF